MGAGALDPEKEASLVPAERLAEFDRLVKRDGITAVERAIEAEQLQQKSSALTGESE